MAQKEAWNAVTEHRFLDSLGSARDCNGKPFGTRPELLKGYMTGLRKRTEGFQKDTKLSATSREELMRYAQDLLGRC